MNRYPDIKYYNRIQKHKFYCSHCDLPARPCCKGAEEYNKRTEFDHSLYIANIIRSRKRRTKCSS